MLQKTINLTTDGRVNMQTYILNLSMNGQTLPKRPAIIILPGGAFTWLSETEAEPVALTFAKEGFHTFVLNYSIGDHSVFPNPLDDVSKAIWELRRNANEWGIHENHIAVMGFSAGACVAAMSATQWNTSGLAKRLGIPEEGIKPNAAVIGYGASLLSTIFDNDDGKDLIVPEPGRITADRTPEVDVVNYVGPHTPPIFFWHNRYDKYVPVINPILMGEAMSKHKLPFEMHIFQSGIHGMSVCNCLSDPSGEKNDKSVGLWVTLCTMWLKNIFKDK
jgi:acetyl esterase/lipase